MMPKPPLPREHGAWAMLIVPLLVGFIVSPILQWRALILLVAAFGFFLVRHPLSTLVKTRRQSRVDRAYFWRWAAIYGGITALSGMWLVFSEQLWLLAVLGLVGGLLLILHLWLVSRRKEMSVSGELIGVFGLSLGAPMAYYVASGQLNGTAAILWLINALYFGGTVFYIKLKVRQQPRRPVPPKPGQRLIKAKACLAYHTLAISLFILLVTVQLAPILAPLALVPAMAKVLQGSWHWQDRKSLNLVRLGVTEIFHAAAFAVLVAAAFR